MARAANAIAIAARPTTRTRRSFTKPPKRPTTGRSGAKEPRTTAAGNTSATSASAVSSARNSRWRAVGPPEIPRRGSRDRHHEAGSWGGDREAEATRWRSRAERRRPELDRFGHLARPRSPPPVGEEVGPRQDRPLDQRPRQGRPRHGDREPPHRARGD